MTWPRRMLTALTGLLAAAVAMERLYHRFLRGWVLNWGTTAGEVDRRLPGDELLEPADIVATRAIGIDHLGRRRD